MHPRAARPRHRLPALSRSRLGGNTNGPRAASGVSSRPGRHDLGRDRDQVVAQVGSSSTRLPRCRWRADPQTRHHQGLVAGPHAPHRREKGRQDPRRRRVAYPRHQLRPSSCRPRATAKAKTCTAVLGYICIHSAVDGFSRLVYTEALPGETAKTAIGFFFRARVWFAAHGITLLASIHRSNLMC